MADVKSGIQAQTDKMVELMTNKKFDELLNFYTEDCKVMPPGAEMIVGKEGMKALIAMMSQFTEKMGKSEYNLLEVFSMGDTATSVSTGVVYALDGSVMDKTKSVAIWKKVDGTWLIYTTIYNHDKPMPMPPQ